MSSSPLSTPKATAAQTQQPTEPKWQDCQACRLTGFATLSGVGAYALYEAGQQGAFAKIRPKGKPIVGAQITAVVGVVFIGLGIGRLFVGSPSS